MRPVGKQVVVYRDNRPVLTLSLSYDRSYEVDGALGPVTIQVEGARVRLLEYNSPRIASCGPLCVGAHLNRYDFSGTGGLKRDVGGDFNRLPNQGTRSPVDQGDVAA